MKNIGRKIELRVKKFINRFFYSERFRNLVWKLYYSPNRRQPEVPISTKGQTYLDELRENGIVCITGKYADLADRINDTYFGVIEGAKTPENDQYIEVLNLGERAVKSGSITAKISFRDPLLQSLFFDPDLCAVVYNYYQRQPFYRNQPVIVRNASLNEVMPKDEITTKYHVDNYRQISFMFLVNDLTVNDTHLQYAIGSHKIRHKALDRFSYNDAQIEEKYKIFDAVGKKGTLLIFDAGSGFHRGIYKAGSVRKVLHTNITTGHYLNTEIRVDSIKNWPEFSKFPPFVKKMMAHVKK